MRGSDPERQISSAAFAYLISEIVQYHTARIRTAGDLERRLQSNGHSVGIKVLEFISVRDRLSKRETGAIEMLQVVLSVRDILLTLLRSSFRAHAGNCSSTKSQILSSVVRTQRMNVSRPSSLKFFDR